MVKCTAGYCIATRQAQSDRMPPAAIVCTDGIAINSRIFCARCEEPSNEIVALNIRIDCYGPPSVMLTYRDGPQVRAQLDLRPPLPIGSMGRLPSRAA